MNQPIEIIGGGLAGLSLGLALRRAGVPVMVLEAADYPRHRVCGEFITGLAPRTMARLGLEPILAGALQHREVAWFMTGAPIRIQQLPSPALGLSRFALDGRLAAALVDAGGELRTHTRITDAENSPGRIFATGRRRGRSAWIGLKIHVRNLALTRDLELHLGEDAYVGLSRVEDGAVNICGLFRQRPISAAPGFDLLVVYLDACGLVSLASRLAAADSERESFCAVAALDFDHRVAGSDRVCLGDACAMIPPFTGNGMAMAFQSAEAALDPLLAFAQGDANWEQTRRATNAALRSRFRLRLASAGALHPFLLRPARQRVLAGLSRARLLPFAPLYAALH
jgi:menaquinone-9 beta-reductase